MIIPPTFFHWRRAPPARAVADASPRPRRSVAAGAADGLHHVPFSGDDAGRESVRRERREIELRVAAGDDVGQNAAGGGRMLEAVAAEAVDQKEPGALARGTD